MFSATGAQKKERKLESCARFCRTKQDKSTAKTASNSTFNELKQIAWRAFIYKIPRALWPFKWVATLTGFEHVFLKGRIVTVWSSLNYLGRIELFNEFYTILYYIALWNILALPIKVKLLRYWRVLSSYHLWTEQPKGINGFRLHQSSIMAKDNRRRIPHLCRRFVLIPIFCVVVRTKAVPECVVRPLGNDGLSDGPSNFVPFFRIKIFKPFTANVFIATWCGTWRFGSKC